MDLWAEAAPYLKDVLFLPGCTSDLFYRRGKKREYELQGSRVLPGMCRFFGFDRQRVTPQLTVVPAPSLDEAFERM
jgi:hypothetical protein